LGRDVILQGSGDAIMIRCLAVLGVLTAFSTVSYADFTYQETTQITGGSMLGMMKMAGAFSKSARQVGEPIASTVMVKGNRMTRISKDRTEIIDLDKDTFTQIDNVKKQYTVMTFEQMKQQMETAMARAKERQQQAGQQPAGNNAQNVDVKFNVQVRNTGAAKDVAGLSADESIMTMTMDATDKTSGKEGSMAITNDMWLATGIPGYDEVREFYKRYAARMGTVFSGAISPSMMAMNPGMSQGMADMAKEMSKLKGIPVLQITRMGTTANGVPLPAASEAPLPASNGPAMPSAGEVAQQSAASAISSRLGALGGLGGFGRKKKADAPPADTEASAAGTPAVMVLMESNTQMESFSQTPIDPARFEVPTGYKQVEAKGLE
jgi:hypothetical protein